MGRKSKGCEGEERREGSILVWKWKGQGKGRRRGKLYQSDERRIKIGDWITSTSENFVNMKTR
jgi:hypothetical protein